MSTPPLDAPFSLEKTCIDVDIKGDVLPKPSCFADYFPEEKTQKGGLENGRAVLYSFLQKRAENYLSCIAKPEKEDTSSRLSPFLTAGVFSMREVFHAVRKREKQANSSWMRRNLRAFSSRLYWRCHFIQKLEDEPAIEFHSMHRGCDDLRPRPSDPQKLLAWKEGKTGYPLVDACMRSLRSTGWLPFRMRAMVMSFASYHLWLDWRDTSPILGALFTDYEPGIHHAQVQMQSGVTGINTFRMYNPIKQSEDHDPQGVFIKTYVEELRAIPQEWIHAPWLMPPLIRLSLGVEIPFLYTQPIIDHKFAIAKARKAFGEKLHEKQFQEEAKRVYEKHGSRKKRAKNSRRMD